VPDKFAIDQTLLIFRVTLLECISFSNDRLVRAQVFSQNCWHSSCSGHHLCRPRESESYKVSALSQSTLLTKNSLPAGPIDPMVCWQALRSRDPRFDGRFFAGLVTTRIYCRTICPVPLNKPENIRWFALAAEAEYAGFRPCRRCNPRISPHAPAWRGTGAVVSRALKLILDGDLDSSKVDALAYRVGMGPRHLRRLFLQHVGISPLKIAQTRRAYAANHLVADTGLPLADIAFRAGFKSVRQFNEIMQTTFGASPSQLRHSMSNPTAPAPNGGIVVHLAYRPPLDWKALIAFLGKRATPGVEKIELDCYRRTIELEGDIGELEIRLDDKRPRLRVRVNLRRYTHLVKVVDRVRRLFDVDADPIQISNHLSRDSRLKELVRSRPGLRIPGAWRGFELAVKAILGESLTAAAPTQLLASLVRAFGRQSMSGNELTHLFPTSADLAQADLGLAGIKGARAIAIRGLAESVCKGKIDFEASCDRAGKLSHLLKILGIDEATANYIVMRAFGEPDVFALEARDFGFSSTMGSWSKFVRTTERWRPWRSYAASHLGRDL
jgi:AraC family transcriptional regulator, regulatory protein of adaptative response / DNA-3-methyladenine glycosylase II